MSFYQENMNFLKIKLYAGTKGMSFSEKSSYYDSIKMEMRGRIQKSHNNIFSIDQEPSTTTKIIFYKELLEHLGEFELNYILTNLLFEENFTNICYWLKSNTNLLKIVNRTPIYRFNSKWFFHLYLLQKDFYQSTFQEFLVEMLSNWTNIAEGNFEIDGNYEVFHQYPNWLIERIVDENRMNETAFIHLIFVRLWNLIPKISQGDEASNIAIIYLHYIIKSYNDLLRKNTAPKLYQFLSLMSTLYKSLLRNRELIKTPILDSAERAYYTAGFYERKKEFLNILEESQYISSDSLNETFTELFEKLKRFNSFVRSKIKDTLIEKIDNRDYPSDNDLIAINQMTGDEEFKEIRLSFYLKLYLFEYD